jgi:DNA-binding PadR family transcriptional regulator
VPVAKRTGVLELAILGILHEGPLHGYELRKRCNALLGSFRAFSYGSLYPALRSLSGSGLIAEDEDASIRPEQPARATRSTRTARGTKAAGRSAAATGKRSRIVYRLTAEGKEHFQELIATSGPASWEDEGFGVHFAFFARTDAATRLRILEGRRSRLEERMAGFRSALTRTRERVDSYTLELQCHGLESAEREVRWLTELIETERRTPAADRPQNPEKD